MIKFADSTQPAKIPSTFTHVAAYPDGLYAWPASQLARFARHFEIAVFPGQPEQARTARALDMERYDATARDFPAFAAERHKAGHDDALGYTSILGQDDSEGIAAIVAAMNVVDLPWRLWVAWYWGKPFPPSAAEVLSEIHALTGIWLPRGLLAACQWRNGEDYDESVWYVRDNFTGTPKPAAATIS